MIGQKRGLLLVVLLFLVLLAIPLVQAGGCILDPSHEEWYCVENIGAAAEACADDPNCRITTNPQACSTLSQCQLVTCAAAQGCESNIPRGLCANVVADDSQCITPVCCQVEKADGQMLCDYVPNVFACNSLAVRERGPGAEPSRAYVADANSCLTSCGATLTLAQLTIIVQSPDLQPISGAGVTIGSTSITTDSSGSALFSLSPGFYDTTILATGFQTQTIHLSLQSGQELTKTVILQEAGRPGTLSGTIFRDQGGVPLPINGATISLSGPSSQESGTAESGTYAFSDLPPGQYLAIAHHPEYGSAQQQVVISSGEAKLLDLTLRQEAFVGVKGLVSLNNIPVPGATILLDGVPSRTSRHDGRYEIPLPADGVAHRIQATYAQGTYSSAEEQFVMDSSVVDKPLVLLKTASACADAWPNVPRFTPRAVAGRLDVVVQWDPVDCLEPHIYLVTITSPDGTTSSSSFSDPASREEGLSFTDRDLEAGKTYTYQMVTVYQADGVSHPSSPISVSITLGNQACIGVSSGSEFCSTSPTASEDIIQFCNENNELIDTAETCDRSAGEYCAPGSEGTVECKQDSSCRSGGAPLGLAYDENLCYYGPTASSASGPPLNFCFYDFTPVVESQLPTLVDACQSCTAISSCFDYKSQAACEKNSCFANADCLWADAGSMATPELVDYALLLSQLGLRENQLTAITQETGQGFCTEAKYQGDDTCSLCGPSSNLITDNPRVFENNLCTPDVCTSLGRCFTEPSVSDSVLSSCASCGESPSPEATCYTYSSELECTRGSAATLTNGIITTSNDTCGWGRCAWAGNTCVKDGDIDGNDDCGSIVQDLQRQQCSLDITPPVTKQLGPPFPTVSLVAPFLNFTGDEEIHAEARQRTTLKELGYCLLPLSSPEACSFTTIPYPGIKKKENVTVPILAGIAEAVQGVPYRLFYYSEDAHSNRESAHESIIFVDNVAPDFTINETIIVDKDQVILKTWLTEQNEAMSCHWDVHPPLSETSLGTADTPKGGVQAASFQFQGVVWAVLKVTCTDSVGNYQSKEKNYTFDLEEEIAIIYPPKQSYVPAMDISFEVATTVDASCSLVTTATNEEVAPFAPVAVSLQHHKTIPIPGFLPREYFQEYKVVCQSSSGNRAFEDHFHFTVDLTPPTTTITLSEQDRIFTPTQRFWETVFIASADVDFACEAEGFDCNATYYCRSAPDDLHGCPPFPSPEYQLFTGDLSLTESSRICYYSTDTGKSVVYSADCGTVLIDGFGITLDNVYFYQGERWIIRPEPVFDWGFSTRIPTRECRFDFQQDFDYDDVLDVQIIFPESTGKYTVRNFPENVFKSYPAQGGIFPVYLKCMDDGGSLSPEVKVYLEYDPNAPTILETHADPDHIFTETRTNIFATTDRKTFCRYSDTSDGSGSTSFETMEYVFPGLDERILHLTHEDIFFLNNFVSPTGMKQYVLSTQCRTGAELLSPVAEILFDVDYSSTGYISDVSPGGGDSIIGTDDITLAVNTSRPADCSYKLNAVFQPFTTTGGTRHSSVLSDLADGTYHIPIHCQLPGGHLIEGEVSFTIDTVPPAITLVEDGNFTCGSDSVNVLVYSDDRNISGYYYEVYDRGSLVSRNTSNSTNATSMGLVRSMATALNTPLNYSTVGLQEGHRYVTKVWLVDGAGNHGASKETDGILVVPHNNSVCTADRATPKIIPITNATCTETLVELRCADAVGCRNISFGQQSNKALCNATRPYRGEKLHFTQSGSVCYKVSDYAGNNASGNFSVAFLDADADGIADSCDTCPGTASGKAVGNDGCTFGEVPTGEKKDDDDLDGLPNFWEKVYDGFGCSLSFASPDSDTDGLSDAQEDYDADGSTNYDEYLANSNPCLAEDTPPRLKTEEPDGPSESGEGDLEPAEEFDVLALTFFIIGVVLTLGGTGYLMYIYRSMGATRSGGASFSGSSSGSSVPPSSRTASPGKKLEQEALKLQKGRSLRQKEKRRAGVFDSFGKESKEIPHVGSLLKAGATSPEQLGKVAKTYTDHKEDIKPGLRPEEKGVFTQLERLAKQAEHRDVSDLVKPQEAKDLFAQLKSIAKRRKQ